MTRDDYIWVGIRLFGVWLAILALIASLQFFSDSLNLWLYSDLPSESFEAIGQTREILVARYAAPVVVGGIKVVCLWGVAWYLLRRGSGLVRWVAPQDRDADAV